MARSLKPLEFEKLKEHHESETHLKKIKRMQQKSGRTTIQCDSHILSSLSKARRLKQKSRRRSLKIVTQNQKQDGIQKLKLNMNQQLE